MAASTPTTESRWRVKAQEGVSVSGGVILVLALAALMWISEAADSVLGGDLDAYGIRPRAVDGLDGIAFSPFLHAGWDHLIGNTIPFLMLGFTIALSGIKRVVGVTLIVALVGGLGTWLVGPTNSIHIGASGIVFGYAAYLVARWLYTRRLLHLAMGLIVAFVWGATLLSGLVPQPNVSWQGHLFGGLGGFVAARMLDGRDRRRQLAERSREPSAFLR